MVETCMCQEFCSIESGRPDMVGAASWCDLWGLKPGGGANRLGGAQTPLHTMWEVGVGVWRNVISDIPVS